jgi:hypothetical integral membrane protein (TIGR02206 family)
MTNEALCSSLFVNCQSPFVAASFQAFDIQHIIALIGIAMLCLLVAKATQREEPSQSRWLRRLIGCLLGGYVFFFYVQQGIEGALTWEYSLPLDLCSLVLAACIVSLIRPGQFITEIAYFWGVGGILQALATPDLAEGFPSIPFILFFWGHGASLMAITFLIMRRGFRPRKGSVIRVMIVLNFYALMVGAVNAIMGWNYGYLCRKPHAPSLLDFLGPWPWYLISIELIALVSFLILYAPWRFRRNPSE